MDLLPRLCWLKGILKDAMQTMHFWMGAYWLQAKKESEEVSEVT